MLVFCTLLKINLHNLEMCIFICNLHMHIYIYITYIFVDIQIFNGMFWMIKI